MIRPARSARFLLLALAFLFAAPAAAQQLQPIDRIVAVVDEDVILQSELDQAMANVLAQYAGREDQLPPRDVLLKQVLDRLALVRLQVARAEATGVQVSGADVDRAVAAIAQQNGATPQQLAEQLAADGLSLDGFRDSVRDELMIQRLRQRFAQSQVRVSDAEVDAALASQDTRQYRLAHILVAVPEGATAEQLAAGQEKITGIQALVERGDMAFAAAAVRYSDSPNALEGGDLGWRTLDEIPAAFADLVRGLQPGQVVGPLPGPSGFQLLKLVEVRDIGDAPQVVTEFQARHILVRTSDTVSVEEAKARIDTVHARLVGGADFAELAKEVSEDAATAGQGGDLGWFPGGAFGPEFAAQLPSLADGEFSAPFRTSAGWHIVQRLGMRQNDASEANRRARMRETIGQRKLEDEWNRFLRELRSGAYVEYRLDAGAGATTD
ncbi:MAG TPA: peptidylprolyl isomerase [Xanthomonadaceae bacterium]|nr:peptidylprolyl isomerase [Xanthomonadaceae bacterium]